MVIIVIFQVVVKVINLSTDITEISPEADDRLKMQTEGLILKKKNSDEN